ncbi:MAG TPA: NAD(P)H-hydrate dehydratase [Bacteroidia bacterium]|nr:NAD(P)H-hydrate dehydratase [Bacteroidia bacterium]
MKILSAKQLREADEFTILNNSITSVDLMERAANACVDWILTHIEKNNSIKIICGWGNNGGDGLAIARLLSEKNISVEVFSLQHSGKYADNFIANKKRLSEKNISIHEIANASEINFLKNDFVIDAIFGIGLNRNIEGIAKDVIEKINRSPVTVISIDIPSGLMSEGNQDLMKSAIVNADYTLTFQTPKLSFLFPSSGKFVVRFFILDIGLSKRFINDISVSEFFVTQDFIQNSFIPRNKFSNKGNYGHVLILAGSYGKIGAAVLSVKACLRSGAGLVTVHIPKCGYEIMQTSIPEAMVEADNSDEFITEINSLEKYSTIAVGPGIGNEKQTQNTLKLLIQNTKTPMVIDADALNILSENKTWLAFIPPNSIFTPHIKEFERLAGKVSTDFDRYQLQKEFAIKNRVFLVLKGAHTAIACPDGEVYFNSTGNPGMAKAGNGDALTGIITALLAQGYEPKKAAVMGVYLHGFAGDLAAEKHSEEAMLASDLIDCLGMAFQKIV